MHPLIKFVLLPFLEGCLPLFGGLLCSHSLGAVGFCRLSRALVCICICGRLLCLCCACGRRAECRGPRLQAVVVAHSFGDNVFRNFLGWVGQLDVEWVDRHVAAYVNVAGPTLGVPKSISALLSGNVQNKADPLVFAALSVSGSALLQPAFLSPAKLSGIICPEESNSSFCRSALFWSSAKSSQATCPVLE